MKKVIVSMVLACSAFGMNRTRLMALLLALTGVTTTIMAKETALKPRLVVCTDIAPADVEPDDMESMVRWCMPICLR